MQLILEHVTHTYQPGSPFQSRAIEDVNLEVHEGEFLALIGHTGSGKSTLAQHFNGLLKPTSGRVLLDGRDIHEKGYDKKEVRRNIGLVFQYPEHQLFDETVEKDVGFGPRNLGLSPEEVKERVQEALLKVGMRYEDVAAKSPFELSGGQMRRVALAGVIAMRPKVLVLDEPIAGLDPLGREELMGMIKQLHLDGTTVVMVSHSMDDVARYATRAAVMDHGKLVMTGTPEEIFMQQEKLVKMGLDVPQVCRLGAMLRENGIPFPENIYREEQALEALRSLLGKEDKDAQ
ncbi:MAG: energy-coupling factor transporter ATPase [Clostridiales bacterium]|nr:energy-coupling factor transporter ATPase [Clostridiales bacterium]